MFQDSHKFTNNFSSTYFIYFLKELTEKKNYFALHTENLIIITGTVLIHSFCKIIIKTEFKNFRFTLNCIHNILLIINK